MKAAMHSHVDAERHVMFQRSVDEVRDRLNGMVKEVKLDLADRVDEIFLQMSRDYRSVLGGGNPTREEQLLPKAQRLVRKELLQMIEECESRFRFVAGVNVDTEKDAEEMKEGNGIDDNKAVETATGQLVEDAEMTSTKANKIKEEQVSELEDFSHPVDANLDGS